jgi:hypothetical protein
MRRAAYGSCVGARSVLPYAFVLVGIFLGCVESQTAVGATNSVDASSSLFDHVFANAQGQVIPPFPFSSLLETLDRYAKLSPIGKSQLKQVLIPYGRSLHRRAAHPHYLRNPRHVVAVDTGGSPTSDTPWFWLKDRMFLAYQPASQSIEVISFDEMRGRFEFQIVSNYRAGARPSVRTANRQLCLSCHHNEGPLFAQDNWDETNANPQLLAAMREAGMPRTNAWLDEGPAQAGALDNATDRANLLLAYHRVWRELCTTQTRETTVRCRAGALLAALQQRLGPFAFFTPRPGLYTEHLVPFAANRWRMLWPDGLSVGNPDLENRHPLRLSDPMLLMSDTDPLNPRPARDSWHPPMGINRVIIGLAESLPDFALARIDAYLIKTFAHSSNKHQAPNGVAFTGPCAELPQGPVRCTLVAPGKARPIDLFLREDSSGEFAIQNVFAFDGTRFYAVVSQTHHTPDARLRTVTAQQGGRDLSLRLANGNRIAQLSFPRTRLELQHVGARANVIDDMAPLEAALERMAVTALAAPKHVLNQSNLQPTKILNAVLATLGLPPTRWFEPPVQWQDSKRNHATVTPSSRRQEAPTPALLTRYCGGCHSQPEPYPPNFLRGSNERLTERLRSCRAQILYRLSLWKVPSAQRSASPMPPWKVLRDAGIRPQDWPSHPDYAELQRSLGSYDSADINTRDTCTEPQLNAGVAAPR